jgi:hypothetical protein
MAFLMAQSPIGYSADIVLQSNIAHNSNPLKINEKFKPNGSVYLDSDIKISQKINDKSSVSLKTNSVNHEGQNDKADESQLEINLKLRAWKRYFNKYLTIHSVDLEYKTFKKTYLNIDGTKATFNDENISERYNYNIYSLDQRNRIKINDRNRLYLSWYYYDIQYKHYNDLNDFDNKNYGFSPTWIHKINSQNTFEIITSIDERDYKDQNNKTLDGTIINDSYLKITSLEYAVKYKFNQEGGWKYSMGLSITNGDDHDSGYFNHQRKTAFSWLSYQVTPKSSVDFQITFSNINYYDRNVTNIQTNSEISQSSRNTYYNIIQTHQIYENTKLKINTGLFMSLIKYNSNLSDYSYKQKIIGAQFEILF